MVRYDIKDIFPWYLEFCNPQTPEEIHAIGEMMREEIDIEVKEAIEDFYEQFIKEGIGDEDPAAIELVNNHREEFELLLEQRKEKVEA